MISQVSENLVGVNPVQSIKALENSLESSGISSSDSQALSNTAVKLAMKNSASTQKVIEQLSNAIKLEKTSASSQLSTGGVPKGNAAFDQALQSLLAKGYTAQEAMERAKQISNLPPDEPTLTSQLAGLSSEQSQILMQLLQKGYSREEALKRANDYQPIPETEESRIINGEIQGGSEAFNQSLAKNMQKYGLKEALARSKKADLLAKEHIRIDQNNIATAFHAQDAKGNVPKSTVFEKMFMKILKSETFETAYHMALEKYNRFIQSQPKPILELLAQGNTQNIDGQQKSKVWWNRFIKEVMKGSNDVDAQLEADRYTRIFNEEMRHGEQIDATLYNNFGGKP